METEDKTWCRPDINLFRAFKEAGFEPHAIFDVGSSDSAWSYSVSQVFPAAQFDLFEPLVGHKASYRDSTAGILQVRPGFRVHKVAIGDFDGTTRMGVDGPGYGASTLITQADGTFTELVEVPVRRLDTIAFELGLPRPELLKMDVQGGELAVLMGSGSLLDTVQLVQVETWFLRRYGDGTPLHHEISDYLNAKGLLQVAFGECYYGELHELYAADAFFARTDLLSRCAVRLPKSSLTEKPEL
jgi:FkbM family methyltransferase